MFVPSFWAPLKPVINIPIPKHMWIHIWMFEFILQEGIYQIMDSFNQGNTLHFQT